MDFRKCPACQASVLEDDVDDCPFCGASMSGKPKPKTTSPKAPSKASSGTKATTAKDPGQKSSKSATGSAKAKPSSKAAGAAQKKDDDDPFEVDTFAVKKAIKLAPRPTKTRTYEIICPMCETKGYMLPQDAGKDVQCANPECLVPVFKSKRPKVEAPPEEESDNKKTIIIAAAAVVLLGVGFAVFSMLSPKDPVVNNGGSQIPDPNGRTVDCDNCPTVVDCDDCKPEEISLSEIRSESLGKIENAVGGKGSGNQNPFIGKQMTAQAFAVSGQIAEAQKHLKRLREGGVSTGYLQLQPAADIAWAQLKKGDTEAATTTAMNAVAEARKVPLNLRRTLGNVRSSLDAATSITAVLVAVGKQDEAAKFISEQVRDAEGDLGFRGKASALWRAAYDSHTFDIGLEASRPYHLVMPEPLRMSVIETLVAKGQEAKAFAVISTAQSVSGTDACRASWAGRLAEMKPETVIEAVSGKESGVSATGLTRMWAAVASHLKTKNQDQAAQVAFDKAIAAAAKIPEPKPEKFPSMKEIYNSSGKAHLGLSNPAEERSSAMACADIALVSVQFQKMDQAKEYMEKSMAYARATSPSPVKAQEVLDECRNQSSVQSQLQRTLDLSSSQVRGAFIRYRKQCQDLKAAADARFQFQVDLLRGIAKAGLLQETWDYAIARHELTDSMEREPFLDSSLPGLLIVLAELENSQDLKQSIYVAFKDRPEFDAVDSGTGAIRVDFQKGNMRAAADNLRKFYRSKSAHEARDRSDMIALEIIGKIQQERSVKETFDFLTTLSDPVLRQDAFLLFAAHTTQAESAPQLWKILNTQSIRDLSGLEQGAVYLGFVTAIPAQ
ncbi:hypothetical protein [Thalassoglobus polymorphus]|nr:hypothetical protein [Thalassoglobus polymorphus]